MEQKTASRNNKNRKVVAFVVARLSSSRLPAKQFKNIGNYPMIRWIIQSLEQCKSLDEIVITTVADPENEPLLRFAETNSLPCFWYDGDINHLTTRLRKAAETFHADVCVLISCDCPLVYAPAIDFLIGQLRRDPDADYISVDKDEAGLVSAQEGVFVATLQTWQRADDLSDRPELKEHMFPVIFQRQDLFKEKRVRIPLDIYFKPHRFSVDTWADLEFMNMLHRELETDNISFELPHVLDLLRRKPQLLEVNAHVHQRALVEDIRAVLFIVDAGNDFGYGHLMRSLELALQITERLSWPVTFMTDDEYAVTILEERGIRTLWGALGRESRKSNSKRMASSWNQLCSRYSLVILDIYWKINLDQGWREEIRGDIPVIVLNRTETWAFEADKIIVPEVYKSATPSEKVIGGLKYAIIRREIRQTQFTGFEKTIDILAYLHLSEHQLLVKKLAEIQGLSITIIDHFRNDFPELLSRSRFFVSGFGYSFYEALFVGTVPVTLPMSPAHENAAMFFYEQTDIEPLILKPDQLLGHDLFKSDRTFLLPSLEDGTKYIVNEIADTMQRIDR